MDFRTIVVDLYTNTARSGFGLAGIGSQAYDERRTLDVQNRIPCGNPLVFFDAIRVKIRDEGMVRAKAIHVAPGVRSDGGKEVPGLWVEQNEGAKFWLRVMNELRNRGTENIMLAVVDGLKGFPDAITAVFPEAVVQTCIVHLMHNSMDFVSWKDRKALAAALKGIYHAVDAKAAEAALIDWRWPVPPFRMRPFDRTGSVTGQPVADAGLGREIESRIRQLAAQLADIDAQIGDVLDMRRPPDGGEDLPVSQHPALIAHEQRQQRVLDAGQVEIGAGAILAREARGLSF